MLVTSKTLAFVANWEAWVLAWISVNRGVGGRRHGGCSFIGIISWWSHVVLPLVADHAFLALLLTIVRALRIIGAAGGSAVEAVSEAGVLAPTLLAVFPARVI